MAVLARRDWQLVPEPSAFVRAVWAELRAESSGGADGHSSQAIEHATSHQYCRVLYEACLGGNPIRQQRAFFEIHKFLYRSALFKTRGTLAAEDAAQAALEKIWLKRHQVRDPGAFLGWCDLVLLTEVLMKKRRDERRERQEVVESDLAAREPDLQSDTACNPHRHAEQGEMRGQVRAAIRACLKNQQHAAVIIGMFLEDHSLKQLADELKLSLENTHKIKQRSLKKLETCAEFMRVYAAWLK
jgi:RNA polymerase sigma factor (sigma-70 family)